MDTFVANVIRDIHLSQRVMLSFNNHLEQVLGGALKEYTGAVFFVDILGVGALTQGKINISKEDFLAHNFNYNSEFSEHQFCAKLLLKFRRILISATENIKSIKVAQLSDCAFIWSEDPNKVVNVARDIMWRSVLGGLLCRGGLANGQIVEPDKINTKLGMFICGSAVTEAVKLEGIGKGARVFIKPELASELQSIPHLAFIPRKSLIDFSFAYEFLWYRYPDHIQSSSVKFKKQQALEGIIKLIAILQYSPKYSWNSSSSLGRLQLASTIDIISSEIEKLDGHLDLKYEDVIDSLEKRSDKKYKNTLNKYQQRINQKKSSRS
ncbi:hypothetical protein KKI90_20385 [Xenorhabdus bovienii]|uniref:hypothetical protein n=1 Tax=Xenorhabdus bovienii TaxID=40576 RepID=UPI00237C7443|nr:hypothetical protein [Xenorhabdus bovienii]MDE1488634.1 hypothetical protein [Xenorhabdus bovienii]MDE9479478.1 hypothetical protein [Xenorhabdus bovienii]MDE9532372.1 hypothetical protein [Xenorhabdus bovienii]